jgi:hypothetical protein
MIHMYYEMNVDDKIYLHQILISYTCMLSIVTTHSGLAHLAQLRLLYI